MHTNYLWLFAWLIWSVWLHGLSATTFRFAHSEHTHISTHKNTHNVLYFKLSLAIGKWWYFTAVCSPWYKLFCVCVGKISPLDWLCVWPVGDMKVVGRNKKDCQTAKLCAVFSTRWKCTCCGGVGRKRVIYLWYIYLYLQWLTSPSPEFISGTQQAAWAGLFTMEYTQHYTINTFPRLWTAVDLYESAHSSMHTTISPSKA